MLLQETHCINAEKQVVPSFQLSGCSLSTKYGFAAFFHEQLKYMLLDQSSLTLEIEWLCMDVDVYKIANVDKPPPMQL